MLPTAGYAASQRQGWGNSTGPGERTGAGWATAQGDRHMRLQDAPQSPPLTDLAVGKCPLGCRLVPIPSGFPAQW